MVFTLNYSMSMRLHNFLLPATQVMRPMNEISIALLLNPLPIVRSSPRFGGLPCTDRVAAQGGEAEDLAVRLVALFQHRVSAHAPAHARRHADGLLRRRGVRPREEKLVAAPPG